MGADRALAPPPALARRHDLARGVLRISQQAIFAWYKERAREHHGLAPSAALHCGSVTTIQRFGFLLFIGLSLGSTFLLAARKGRRREWRLLGLGSIVGYILLAAMKDGSELEAVSHERPVPLA